MKIKTLKELEEFDKKAHDLLIQIWAGLSRISEKTAKRDSKENIGSDYEIVSDAIGIKSTNTYSGEILFYSNGDWN